MRGLRPIILVAVFLSLSYVVLAPSLALAYVGPGPGAELIPYFSSLLVWVGLALGAAVLWPIHALLSKVRNSFRRNKGACPETGA